MSITRRCDYACRIIRAAYKNAGSYISIAEVAEQEDIPYSFARSIQHELVKAGFLSTNRGVRGGLTLACDPDTTTVYDIFEAIRGTMSVADCTAEDFPCVHKDTCSFNAVWRAADVLVTNFYRSITLTELFERGRNHPSVQAALARTDAQAS